MIAKKLHLTLAGDSTDSDEEHDDKELVRSSLVIKLPGKNKQTTPNVIVIDDSSDTDSTISEDLNNSTDVKPDLQFVNRQSKEQDGTNAISMISSTLLQNCVDSDAKPDNQFLNKQSHLRATISKSKSPTASIQLNVNDSAISSSVVAPRSTNRMHTDQPDSSLSLKESSSSTHCANKGLQSVCGVHTTPKHSTQSVSQRRTRTRRTALEVANSQSKKRVSEGTSLSFFKNRQLFETIPASQLCRNVSVQTDNEGGAGDGIFQTLQTLRANVLRLLKTIVPTLDDFGNLEFVDSVVIEMVRVSDVSDSSTCTMPNGDCDGSVKPDDDDDS